MLDRLQVREIWRRITTTHYARALEAELARERAANAEQGIEIARLRAENRALLNSILGIAGIPPLPATEADLAFCTAGVPPAQLPSIGQVRRQAASEDDACHAMHAQVTEAASDSSDVPDRMKPVLPNRSASHVAAPMRRRSWPQIHRLLEFESAQKEKPAAEPLPPARQ